MPLHSGRDGFSHRLSRIVVGLTVAPQSINGSSSRSREGLLSYPGNNSFEMGVQFESICEIST